MAKSGYDLIANEYYEDGHITSRNFDQITRKALESAKFEIGDGLVLECGAGRGRAGEYLQLKSSQIIQLDASAEMLALKDRENCLVKVHADACSMPLAAEQFQGVVGFLADPFLGLEFLSEAYRVLVNGGELLLTTPTEKWGEQLRNELGIDPMSTRFKILGTDEIVILPSNLHSKERLKQMLHHIGFTEINVESHYLSDDIERISGDISSVLEKLGLSTLDLPIIYSVRAKK